MEEVTKFLIELAITLAATFILAKHQGNIETWIAQINDRAVLKKMDKAVTEYRYICNLKNDHARLIATLTFHQTMCLVAFLFSGTTILLSAYSVIMLDTDVNTRRILAAFNIDTGNHPLLTRQFPKVADDISVYITDILSVTIISLSYIFLALGFMRLWKVMTINRRISNFESFKKEIENKWGEDATKL